MWLLELLVLEPAAERVRRTWELPDSSGRWLTYWEIHQERQRQDGREQERCFVEQTGSVRSQWRPDALSTWESKYREWHIKVSLMLDGHDSTSRLFWQGFGRLIYCAQKGLPPGNKLCNEYLAASKNGDF